MKTLFVPHPGRPGVILGNHRYQKHTLWLSGSTWSINPKDATPFEDEAIASLAILDALRNDKTVINTRLALMDMITAEL